MVHLEGNIFYHMMQNHISIKFVEITKYVFLAMCVQIKHGTHVLWATSRASKLNIAPTSSRILLLLS